MRIASLIVICLLGWSSSAFARQPQRTLSAGYVNSCKINTQGALYCWGDNSKGQLGDGTLTPHTSATPVQGLTSGVWDVEVATDGYDICAIQRDANNLLRLYCWGDNTYGQIGDGTTTDRHTPTLVHLAGDPIKVVVSGYHTCALISANGYHVQCWGENTYGQIGVGYNSPIVSTPTYPINGDSNDVFDVDVGGHTTCVTHGYQDAVKCFGYNGNGQLGVGDYQDRNAEGPSVIDDSWNVNKIPGTQTKYPILVTSVQVGAQTVCAQVIIYYYGSPYWNEYPGIYCWGAGDSGQLGNGTFSGSTTAVFVHGAASGALWYDQLSVGRAHVCVYNWGGPADSGWAPSGVYCWGDASSGEQNLFYANLCRFAPCDSSNPQQISGGQSFALSTGYYDTCVQYAYSSTDPPQCTGYNGYYELGDNTTTTRWRFQNVLLSSGSW